jgi:hypothetical protein
LAGGGAATDADVGRLMSDGTTRGVILRHISAVFHEYAHIVDGLIHKIRLQHERADKVQSGIRNVRQSAATVGDMLSNEVEWTRWNALAPTPRSAWANKSVKIRTIVSIISFLTVMLFVGFFGDRLMW